MCTWAWAMSRSRCVPAYVSHKSLHEAAIFSVIPLFFPVICLWCFFLPQPLVLLLCSYACTSVSICSFNKVPMASNVRVSSCQTSALYSRAVLCLLPSHTTSCPVMLTVIETKWVAVTEEKWRNLDLFFGGMGFYILKGHHFYCYSRSVYAGIFWVSGIRYMFLSPSVWKHYRRKPFVHIVKHAVLSMLSGDKLCAWFKLTMYSVHFDFTVTFKFPFSYNVLNLL